MKLFADPKVKVISLEEFIQRTDSFCDGAKSSDDVWYVTHSFCVIEIYKFVAVNFGEDYEERFDYFQIALRDGVTEYEAIKKKLVFLENQVAKNNGKWRYKRDLREYKKFIKVFPEYRPYAKATAKDCFKEALVDVNYQPIIKNASDYVVLDVETNGLRKKDDDLLSISIYSPSLGKCYNRFLPLDLQPGVKTTMINGITAEDLYNQYHLNQEEVDKIVNYFDLKNKKVLVYSGNNDFDYAFITNYLTRHGLLGFENLQIENIKRYVPSGAFGLAGSHSKDALCNIFGIDGVKTTHSGLNDCLLEWKLFEKFIDSKPIEINGKFYKFNGDYIIPITVLCNNPKLFKYANIEYKYLLGTSSCVFKHVVFENPAKNIRKYDTNISGISLENIISSSLKAEYQDNKDFLIKNKKKLEEIGKLESNYYTVQININDDGTLKALNECDREYIDQVNESALALKEELETVINFIKHDIFQDDPIKSQELVFSEDKKIFALCDLSSKNSVLEIKTYRPSLTPLGYLHWELAQQLYYESKGRDIYYMIVDFLVSSDAAIDKDKKAICSVEIYKVDLRELSQDEYNKVISKPTQVEEQLLRYLKENPNAKNKNILDVFPSISKKSLSYRIQSIIEKGLAEKIGTKFNYHWVVKV